MRRIDRLLLKIQEAQRLEATHVRGAIVGFNQERGKWQMLVDLVGGKGSMEYERLDMDFESKEAALQGLEELERVHAPTGKRIQTDTGYLLVIDDIGWCD